MKRILRYQTWVKVMNPKEKGVRMMSDNCLIAVIQLFDGRQAIV